MAGTRQRSDHRTRYQDKGVASVFELIGDRVSRMRKLSRLSHDREPDAERISDGCSRDESARLDADYAVDTASIAFGQTIDSPAQRCGVAGGHRRCGRRGEQVGGVDHRLLGGLEVLALDPVREVVEKPVDPRAQAGGDSEEYPERRRHRAYP